MKSRIWQSVLVVCFLAVGVGFGIFTLINQPEPKYPDNGLPVFDFSLKDVTLETIKDGDKSTKYSGNELAIFTAGQESDYFNVEIKGRGNTTWDEDKKPFQIEFRHAVDLFGMGKSRKWVLLANVFDDTNLRNDIAMRIAEMLDEKTPRRGRFVELYFDGEYEGIYYVMHKVEIGKNSVDLRDDMGVLVELDAENRNEVCHNASLGGCLVLKDTVNKNDEEEENLAFEDFLVKYALAEKAAKAGDFDKVSKYLDIDSFVRYFLVNEFTVNPDAYSMSFFMYKNGLDDKIHAGPVWDFDYALGNRNWDWTKVEDFYSPEEIMVLRSVAFDENGSKTSKMMSKLVYYLMDMPEFVDEVERIFREKLSGRERELRIYIASLAERNRDAIIRDSEKWDKDDFDEEMDYLINWIERRYKTLELEFGNSDKNGTIVQ